MEPVSIASITAISLEEAYKYNVLFAVFTCLAKAHLKLYIVQT